MALMRWSFKAVPWTAAVTGKFQPNRVTATSRSFASSIELQNQQQNKPKRGGQRQGGAGQNRGGRPPPFSLRDEKERVDREVDGEARQHRAPLLAQVRQQGASPSDIKRVEKAMDEAEKDAKKLLVRVARMTEARRKSRRRSNGNDISYRNAVPEVPTDMLISKLIQSKRTVNMTRGGRRQRMSALVVVGNGNGAAGFAVGKAQSVPDAIKKGLARAVRRMEPIVRLNSHTIHHDLSAKFSRTKVFMQTAPKDHGTICHKHIMSICEVAGIDDIRANVIGSTNPLNLVRATFMALTSQQSIADIAKARGKSVLEFSGPDFPVIAKMRVKPRNKHRNIAPAKAQEVIKEWLESFPREETVENFELAREIFWQLRVTGESEIEENDIGEWARSLPTYMDVSNTIMDSRLLLPKTLSQ